MSRPEFQLICEIEPPTRPDLTHARHQIGVMAPVADAFLIPDNHIGRATVSSIAVAHEVQKMCGPDQPSIACVNSRDRNLLGFRRDLLTAAAYGVDRFLFVHGDKPTVGDRAGGLTVRTMLEEARAADEDPMYGPYTLGVAAAISRPFPAWKREADFVFAQVSYSIDGLLRWREENPVDAPVFVGVMVLASAAMARRLAASIPDIQIPDELVRRVEADPVAGVDAACEQVLALRDTGAFAGVHLVPVSRFRQVAARLEQELAGQ
jgi:5,10-methylenetetrahydrofolate reductase